MCKDFYFQDSIFHFSCPKSPTRLNLSPTRHHLHFFRHPPSLVTFFVRCLHPGFQFVKLVLLGASKGFLGATLSHVYELHFKGSVSLLCF